jgi:hypothetical protein
MGYVRDQMVVVSGWQRERVARLWGHALDLFGPECVSPVLPGLVNSRGYFLIGGSGSKQGWSEAERHEAAVQAFLKYAEGHADWISVTVLWVGEYLEDVAVQRWRNVEQDDGSIAWQSVKAEAPQDGQ